MYSQEFVDQLEDDFDDLDTVTEEEEEADDDDEDDDDY